MKLQNNFEIVGAISAEATDAVLGCIMEPHWKEDDYRKAMVQHTGEYQSIMLRHSPEYDLSTVRDMPLLPLYAGALSVILDRLSELYVIDDYVAFLASISAGGHVAMHTDNGDFLEKIHRIHIPLKTNQATHYIFEDESVHMECGLIYEIDNTRPHACINHGASDRIHLIVNVDGERR